MVNSCFEHKERSTEFLVIENQLLRGFPKKYQLDKECECPLLRLPKVSTCLGPSLGTNEEINSEPLSKHRLQSNSH